MDSHLRLSVYGIRTGGDVGQRTRAQYVEEVEAYIAGVDQTETISTSMLPWTLKSGNSWVNEHRMIRRSGRHEAL